MALPDQAAGRGGTVFYGWRIVGATFVTQFVTMGTVFYSYGVLLKPLSEDLGGSRLAVGAALPLLVFVGAIAGPVVGREADRRPIKLLMGLGVVLLSTGFVALSRAEALWQFYLAFGGLIALATALLGPLPSTTLVNNWFARTRGTAIGVSQIGISLSGMVMAYVTTALVAQLGWRGTALVFAVLPVVIVAPVVAAIVVNRPEEMGLHPDGDDASLHLDAPPPEAGAFSFRQAYREPQLWLIAVMVGLNFGANGAVIQIVHSHATDLGHSAASAAGLLSAMAGTAALGKPLFGMLADRTTPRIAMATSIALQMVGVGLFLTSSGVAALGLASVVFGAGYGGVMPLYGILIAASSPRAFFGRMMGAAGPLMLPFQMLGLPFATWVFDRTGSYQPAFAVFLGCFAVSAVLLAALRPGRHP